MRKGIPCPVTAVVGLDPTIYLASGLLHSDWRGSELDFVGYLKGEPLEVIEGRNGLPIPARAEIALEGEVRPNDGAMEGPFGEWAGYSDRRETYRLRVNRVLFRNDPILTVADPSSESRPGVHAKSPFHCVAAGGIWYQMEMAGVRMIRGVAFYTQGLKVVSITNDFAGHSTQAGLIASQCHAGAYATKYVIVVDDDIDPYDIAQVMWAVSVRSDPERSVQVQRRCWGTRMDPGLRMPEFGMLGKQPAYNSRAIIDACRPVEYPTDWQRAVTLSPELRARVVEKFGKVLLAKRPIAEGIVDDM